MEKEKHPVYRWVMGGFIALLVIGLLMFVAAVVLGDVRVVSGPTRKL